MTESFDLDAVRAAHIEANPLQYRTLKLYGREWNIRELPNVFTILDFADRGGSGGQVNFLLGFVAAEQREEFAEALRSDEHLDEKLLEALTDFLIKGVVGRPTEPSSPSGGSSSETGITSTVTPSDAPAAGLLT